MKLYTSKSNAKRAAKAAMSNQAIEGKDFTILENDGKFGFIPDTGLMPEQQLPPVTAPKEPETVVDEPKPTTSPADAKKGRPKSTTGVIAVMQSALEKATVDNPTSKESILSVLKKKFPERDARKMMVSINTMIPTDFRNQRGLNIQTVKTDGQRTYFVAA